MNQPPKPQFVLATALLLVVTLLILHWINHNSRQLAQESNKNMDGQRAVLILAEHLGYGNFVSNFRLYLRTGDFIYHQAARDQLEILDEQINAVENLGLGNLEISPREIWSELENNLILARQLWLQGQMSGEQIEDFVAADDDMLWQRLQSLLVATSQQVGQRIGETQAAGLSLRWQLWFLLLVMTLVAFVAVVAVLHRFFAEQEFPRRHPGKSPAIPA